MPAALFLEKIIEKRGHLCLKKHTHILRLVSLDSRVNRLRWGANSTFLCLLSHFAFAILLAAGGVRLPQKRRKFAAPFPSFSTIFYLLPGLFGRFLLKSAYRKNFDFEADCWLAADGRIGIGWMNEWKEGWKYNWMEGKKFGQNGTDTQKWGRF